METMNALKLALWPFLVAWLWTEITPIQEFVVDFNEKQGKLLKTLLFPLECFKCLSFWLTLIVTFDPLTSLLIAFIASWYEQHR